MTPGERARWIALADDLGATCTGGSDWYGPDAPNALPGVDLPDHRSGAARLARSASRGRLRPRRGIS